MFAIYDIQGWRFKNTLEHLHKIRATPAIQRASLRTDDGEQALQNLAEQTTGHTPANPTVSLKARKAYREILHVTEREAIVHAHQLMGHPVKTVQLTLDIVSAWKYLREQHHQLPVLDEQ